MTFKPNLSRLARLSAGSRPSLPGQDPMREEELRLELTQELKPKDRFEQIWIEDIAYRVAMIEVIRAQIAGCRSRLVQDLLHELHMRAHERKAAQDPEERGKERPLSEFDLMDIEISMSFQGPDLNPSERAAHDRWIKYGTVPMELSNWLGDQQFAWLLGNLDPIQMQVLRQFQILEQEEVRERDRIIRQFERRRRQEVMDAVKLAEVRRQSSPLEELETSALEVPAHATEVVDDFEIEEAAANVLT